MSNIKTRADKYCDAAARYTAEFYLNDLEVTDRAVVSVDISCFAPTRSKAKSDLRKTLEAVIEVMQKSIEELK